MKFQLPPSHSIVRQARCAAAVLTLSLASSGQAGPTSSKSPQEVPPPEPLYPGTVVTGFKTSDVYTEGHFSIVAPVWSTLGVDGLLAGDYVFLEPYLSSGEGGEVAASLGLGWRHLFGSQPVKELLEHDGHQAGFLEEGVFIGANVFLDMLDTETNHQFWQLGFGVEVGNRYLELRGNYYLPLTDRQEVESFRTSETFASSKTRYASRSSMTGEPFATGNSIQQGYTQSTFATTSTRTTTIERLFRRYEEGMEGWDAEIALLLPWIDRYMDVKLIGGYYAFDNQPFGPQSGGTGNVEGWKAGVEIRPVPAIVLNATWYEDERLTGSDWTVGMQMQIPFEAGDLGDGKNFWSRIGDSFKPRRRHLAERMAEPARRQNTAIKLAGGVEEDRDEKKTTTTMKRVTRVVSQTKGSLVLADDIVFVNNGGAVGNGIAQAGVTQTGKAEQPFDTIQKGADLAATNNAATQRVWNVYTQGAGAHGGGDYNESVTLYGSTRLISSKTPIYSPYGGSFGTGDLPKVNGGFAGDSNLFLNGAGAPSLVGVRGYEVNGHYDFALSNSIHGSGLGFASGAGIYLANVDQVEIVNNIVRDAVGYGFYASHDQNLQLLVANNTISSNGLSGSQIITTGDINGTVVGNLLENNGAQGIVIHTDGNFTGDVTDNTASSNGFDGIVLGTGGEFMGNIANNTANSNGDSGISSNVSVSFTGNISGNTTTHNGYQGINSIVHGDLIGDIVGNTASDNTGANSNGIYSEVSGDFTGDIAGNTTKFNTFSGIHSDVTGNFTGNINGNIASDNDGRGLYNQVGGAFTGGITGNTAKFNGVTGIFSAVGTSFTGDIAGNTTNDNGDNGSVFSIGTDFTGQVAGNTASYNDFNGIQMLVGGAFMGDTTGNVMSNNAVSGFYIESTDYTGSFTGNAANNNNASGFYSGVIILNGGPFTGNDATGNGGANFNNTNQPLIQD